MAAYGDYLPGYIGTDVAYSQVDYETQPSSSPTATGVERVLMDAIRHLRDRARGPARVAGLVSSVMIREEVTEGGGRAGTGSPPG
jgi:hypothetical protein